MRFNILLSFLLLAGLANAQVGVETAPDFTAKDIAGKQHHLYEYLDAGSFVVIDFFTTNCGPCQTYASHVSASYEYFGCNSGNVVFLGINWGSDNEAVEAFDLLWGASYPSISGLQGGGNAVVDLFQVLSYPSVILIAPDRSILNNHIWPPETDSINTLVLNAGGLPNPCTVDVENHILPSSANLRILQSGYGNVQLEVSQLSGPGGLLQVFGSDGRLVASWNLSGNEHSFHLPVLKQGIYFARLTYKGIVDESLKFPISF